MRIHRSIIEKARDMKREGLTNSAIASALGIGKRTVVRHTAWLGPRSLMGVRRVLPPHAEEMTAAKAGIHAYLVADGNRKASKPRRDESYRRVSLEFWNTNPVLLRDFANRVKQVYDYQAWIDSKRGRVEVRRVAVVQDLLRYGPYGSRKWTIPRKIMDSDLDIRREWVRCFGDAEGHVSKSKNEITVKSVNLSGLEKLKQMLSGLGIFSHINGPYEGAYVLRVSRTSDVKRYAETISFLDSRKRQRLVKLTVQKKVKVARSERC